MTPRSGGRRVDLFAVLEEIRPRPVLLIGSSSLVDLRVWLEGLDFGLRRVGGCLVSDPTFYHFHRFAQLRLGFRESTSGWTRMITDRSDGEPGSAISRFFELFDEFRALGPTRHVAEMTDRTKIARTTFTSWGNGREEKQWFPARFDLYQLPAPIGWYYYHRDESPRDFPPTYVAGPEEAHAQVWRSFGVPDTAWSRPRRARSELRAL